MNADSGAGSWHDPDGSDLKRDRGAAAPLTGCAAPVRNAGEGRFGGVASLRARFLVLALTTGAFCAVFACFVSMVTEALALWQVACIGGMSGFLGSLLASCMWMRR